MARPLKNIHWNGNRQEPMYFVFSDEPVAVTESHHNGEVNVDLDRDNEVIGIEVVFPDAETFETLFEIVKARNLAG